MDVNICPVCGQPVELERSLVNSGFESGDQIIVPKEHLLPYPVDGKEKKCDSVDFAMKVRFDGLQTEIH